MRWKPAGLLVLFAMAVFLASSQTASASSRHLTFEQRVEAQRAIERVYYSHQIGATLPFEDAVTRKLLETKVRLYLKQSVALETIWHTPVTAEMLSAEASRMARGTRMPDRLRELHAALGDDPLLIQECLVRPGLVDRLARAAFANDETIHGASKMDWDAWWTAQQEKLDELSAPTVASPDIVLTRLSSGAESLAASCAPEDVWDNGSLPVGAPGPGIHSSNATAIWTGSRVLLWGGLDAQNGVSNKGEIYDPATDTWADINTAGAPAPRAAHSAVWTGSRMIVWGGSAGTSPYVAQQTGGSYDPVSNTWSSTPLAGAPSARAGHTAVWTGTRMIVWGGYGDDGTGNSGYLNSGGIYDPVSGTWSATSLTNAPSSRNDHTAVWTGSRMVVWGGFDGSAYLSTGGRFDPVANSWTPTSTNNAPALSGHVAVWTGSEIVVFGGGGNGARYTPNNDRWRSSSLTLDFATAVWTGSRVLLWGFNGNPQNTGVQYDPVHDSFTEMTMTGGPLPRDQTMAVWAGNVLMIAGGNAGRNYGRYDPTTDAWLSSSPLGTSPRADHTAVWTGNVMIVWGGTDSTSTQNTGSRYDPALDSWTPVSLTGAPLQRTDHTAVWTGSEMIVWGGRGSADYAATDALATGGRYNPISNSWTPTSSGPGPRFHHTAVWTGTRMILWGGAAPAPPPSPFLFGIGNGAAYDPASDTWTSVSTTNGPGSRYLHSAVWTGTSMILWGGCTSGLGSTFCVGGFNTGSRYDPSTNTWMATSTVNAPAPRNFHTAVWTGGRMIVWGGGEGSGGFSGKSTGGVYDPIADSWTPTSMTGAPSARLLHTAVWTGKSMIVWGGRDTSQAGTGARYFPGTDQWTPVSMTDSPSARESHSAVWTGESMIVWGGLGPEDLNTGGRYFVDTAVDADSDGFAGCSDCDDAQPSVHPGASQVCGDGLNNDCSFPGWPALVGTNEADDDGDGLTECSGDCNDAAVASWTTPGEARDLSLPSGTMLSWSPPASLGGSAVRYDALRASSSGDFVGATTCVETDDGSDTAATDPAVPPLGESFYYLVRARNDCPPGSNLGPLGFASDGTPRSGRSCP